MDHIQPNNEPINAPLPLGQKLFVRAGNDAALKIGPSCYGSVATRSNDLPSSSQAAQYSGHRVKHPGALHNSYVHYPSGSSHGHLSYNAQTEPAITYPHRSEEEFTPVSSQIDNRTAAVKRKNPIIYPEYSINGNGYCASSSSSAQFSNYPQPTLFSESQIPPSIGPSNWNGQSLVNQEGTPRNVRARHNYANISLEPRPVQSVSNVAPSTSMKRNGTSFPRMGTTPSGASGMSSHGRSYYPMGSSNSTAPVPTLHGSSGSAIFTNDGVFAPRTVHGDTIPSYIHLPSVPSSSSTAIPHEVTIPSYPPTSATTSTSTRANQPFPIRAVASSRHARNVPVIGHANSGRNRRARSSYDGYPLMIDAQHLIMMQQLALLRQSREAQDPHRAMRLDIDNMSYEDLLALGESIGNVSTGLADEKISGCVREVIFCSSDEQQNDQDDGSCPICLEEYKDNSLLGILKCNHDFHTDCIKNWLKKVKRPWTQWADQA
uniref:RING-type E3 ubiquitin transferase n=1 Tax=Leersia perrieri TaxID=77586 RepID=A0A0D9UX19_9ORYZ